MRSSAAATLLFRLLSSVIWYLNKALESLVVLLEIFEKADGFVVTAAEVSINLLHLLSILL